MSKKKPSYVADNRFDRLHDLERRLAAAFEDGDLGFTDDPRIAALRKEYDDLHAELYPRDLFDRVLDEIDEEEGLMDRIEALLAERADLHERFKGQTRDARAIELEKNQELRTYILTQLNNEEGSPHADADSE